MKIFLEKPGVLRPESVWVCMHAQYIYIAYTLPELVQILNTEWEHAKHLAM